MTVLIAGGGIAGLSLALSCHQVGIPFKVFEASPQMRPLGVGINLQPAAVRELYALGFEDPLDRIGLQTQDFGLYTQKGHHIWTEPRGRHLGYHWPQYSVHRGHLLMMLYDALKARAGPDSVVTGCRVRGFDNAPKGAVVHVTDAAGVNRSFEGAVLIGADGIHSAIRRQMVPKEGPPKWSGAILWRGVTQAIPFLTGASMIMVGGLGLRFVSYPISCPDPVSGKSLINWIAERRFDPSVGYSQEDYSRAAKLEDFMPRFQDLRFDWLDIPALITGAGDIFEYPMIDRDPLDQWTQGCVSLMGDAAHAAYPVGSNGAGAGILDARKLTAAFLQHGLTNNALHAYEAEMRPATSKMVLTNRSAGPDQILDVVDARSGGQFTDISEVISQQEMQDHAATYKRIAGFGVRDTNDRADIIPEGAVF